jgi:hypothetical protein
LGWWNSQLNIKMKFMFQTTNQTTKKTVSNVQSYRHDGAKWYDTDSDSSTDMISLNLQCSLSFQSYGNYI